MYRTRKQILETNYVQLEYIERLTDKIELLEQQNQVLAKLTNKLLDMVEPKKKFKPYSM